MPSVSAATDKRKGAESQGARRRLIEAAREEFGLKGIEAATTRGIAERAGCNEVTLFRHFETKQKLLAAVVQDASEEFRSLCTCRERFSGDPRADFLEIARVYSESLDRCEGMARAIIAEGQKRPTLCRELIGDVMEPLHLSIRNYLNGLKTEGRVRSELNVTAFAELFTAALFAGCLRRSSGLSALDRDGWISETVDVFVHGIGLRDVVQTGTGGSV